MFDNLMAGTWWMLLLRGVIAVLPDRTAARSRPPVALSPATPSPSGASGPATGPPSPQGGSSG